MSELVLSRADAFRSATGLLVHAPAIVCDPDTPIRTAAELMTESEQTAIVVRLDGHLGILTDRDLRARVVAGGLSTDSPVSAVISTPARTVSADRLAGEVLTEMLDAGIHHFPVTTADGHVLGIVDANDLLALEGRSPFQLRTAIEHATSVPDCVAAAAELWPTVIALHEARLVPAQIAEVISIMTTALTRRLIDLGVADRGSQPAEFAWLALGSLARHESMPSSDIDCAISWEGADDDPALGSWMREVAAAVIAGLESCGFPSDSRNALASHPLFSRSLAEWRSAAASLINDPQQDQALILASVIIEARPIWGTQLAAATSELFASASARTVLGHMLARLALSYRPALSFRGKLALERSGEHRGTLDIKRGGLIPIIDLARYAGIAAGFAAGSTRERLKAASTAGTLDAGDARTLQEAFDLLLGIRLDHQIEQLRTGQAIDNLIDPTHLDRLTRELLKDTLQAVAAVQHTVDAELDLRLR
jgi:CBS domain-containing protein